MTISPASCATLLSPAASTNMPPRDLAPPSTTPAAGAGLAANAGNTPTSAADASATDSSADKSAALDGATASGKADGNAPPQAASFAQVLARELAQQVAGQADAKTLPAIVGGAKETDKTAGPDTTDASALAALLPLMLGAAANLTGIVKLAQPGQGDEHSPDTGKRVAAASDTTTLSPATPTFLAMAATSPATLLGQANEGPATLRAPGMAAISAGLPAQIGSLAADDGRQAASAAPDADFNGLLAAAQAALPQAASARNSAPASLKIDTPLGRSGWGNEVGDKLTWMVGHQEQHAELVLHPPELGRVDVSLSLNGDQATASFASANPLVRYALEAALPRLREILADAGVSLGQTQVGSEAFNHAKNNAESGDNPRGGWNALPQNTSIQGIGAPLPWLRQGNGLVDVFA